MLAVGCWLAGCLWRQFEAFCFSGLGSDFLRPRRPILGRICFLIGGHSEFFRALDGHFGNLQADFCKALAGPRLHLEMACCIVGHLDV